MPARPRNAAPPAAGAAEADGGGYSLGIDLGITNTAAATCRGGVVADLPLGEHSPTMPTAVYLGPDGSVDTGEAALGRGAADPGRLARQFKRRFGDSVPLLLEDAHVDVADLVAHVLRSVASRAEAQEGGPPAAVALTYPADWGGYKRNLLRTAGERAGFGATVSLLTEPEAAARAHDAGAPLDVGATVLVYAFGGSTCAADLVRRTADGYEAFGDPHRVEVGGADLDALVLRHVDAATDGAVARLELSGDLVAAAQLRAAGVEAKEALSTDAEARLVVRIGQDEHDLRITRTEFEELARPLVRRTLEAMDDALDGAGLPPADLAGCVLVGGSARVPLVADLVGRHLDLAVNVDPRPQHVVARGAALAAAALLPSARGSRVGRARPSPRSLAVPPAPGGATPIAAPPVRQRTPRPRRDQGSAGEAPPAREPRPPEPPAAPPPALPAAAPRGWVPGRPRPLPRRRRRIPGPRPLPRPRRPTFREAAAPKPSPPPKAGARAVEVPSEGLSVRYLSEVPVKERTRRLAGETSAPRRRSPAAEAHRRSGPARRGLVLAVLLVAVLVTLGALLLR